MQRADDARQRAGVDSAPVATRDPADAAHYLAPARRPQLVGRRGVEVIIIMPVEKNGRPSFVVASCKRGALCTVACRIRNRLATSDLASSGRASDRVDVACEQQQALVCGSVATLHIALVTRRPSVR
jgi:hypothetical protein